MNMPRESAARRLPAEWEPQDAVMLTWPHDDSDWAPTLHEVEPVFVAIAVAVCAREQLLLVVRDAAHLAHVESLLEAAGVDMACVRAVIAPSNDTWARDHGPITVHDAGTPRLLDFVFNGWGGKFEAALDDALSARLHEAGVFGAAARERIAFVLEGGSLESDGAGTLITTHECQHHAGRNPALDTAAIEAQLPTLRQRKLLIWGMKDWCFRPECLLRFADHWPDADIEECSRAGHYVLLDEPEIVISRIRNFLLSPEGKS
jgi:agmatine/peptidylarginine deiminase